MERPILFSEPMVKALLSGEKTQTRRLVKSHPLIDGANFIDEFVKLPENHVIDDCPIGRHGDLLYVRESFSYCHGLSKDDVGSPIWYWADGNPNYGDWTRPKPSIHMPRWASRLILSVTDVRIQRLQEISAEDAEQEGVCKGVHDFDCVNGHFPDLAGYCVNGCGSQGYVEIFQRLWQSINGPESWATNPWVWAITFEVKKL